MFSVVVIISIFAAVAQEEEQVIYNQKVAGLNPRILQLRVEVSLSRQETEKKRYRNASPFKNLVCDC